MKESETIKKRQKKAIKEKKEKKTKKKRKMYENDEHRHLGRFRVECENIEIVQQFHTMRLS